MSQLVQKKCEENLCTAETTRNGATYTPRFDIIENDDGLVLLGDMPGVAPEDLEVRFENEHLIVHGKVARDTRAASWSSASTAWATTTANSASARPSTRRRSPPN